MKRTKLERIRLGFIFVLVILFFVTAVARLVHLQIINGAEYSQLVDRQSSGKVSIPAARGFIYDRSGKLVASNVYASSLYASPTSASELRNVSNYLDGFYGKPSGTATSNYGLGIKRFSWINRCMPDEVAEQIAETAPSGLYLRKETQRKYPYGLVGRQILGFTDVDNRGCSGIELTFDSMLAGENGWADIRRDGLRNRFRVKEHALVKPVAGRSLVLTVDWRFQEMVEKELREAVEKYNAKSAMAAFLDCSSGEVLAIAHFDPGEENPGKPYKLRAVTDQFEPGSSFKIISAAALLNADAVDFDDSTFCENGEWKIGRRVLHDSEEHGWLDFRSVFELSSNIGLAKHAIELGGEEIFEATRKFGIGRKSEIGLPGESAGSIARPASWSSSSATASLAIGYGVAVTTLQLASSIAAVANGGELYRPQLVAGYVDDDGTVIEMSRPHVVGRPMKQATVDTLLTFLRGVVANGTAVKVDSKIITIAGKTGTALMVNHKSGGYYWGRHMASFVGFFPYEQPLIAGAVVLEDPRPVYYGGWTAGPTFKRIAERYTVIKPDLFASQISLVRQQSNRIKHTSEVPNLVGRDVNLAEELATDRGLELRNDNDRGVVVWQYPPADRLVLKGDVVLVAVQSAETKELVLPDMRGLSIRQASAYLSFLGIKFKVNGIGEVVRQSPSPGKKMNADAICRLQCAHGREET